ncbi:MULTISPECIES: class I SAM-dependent methyltransferase [unclassified Paludibacterium]|uniref:class I SAM-dependent methyltransferase n=1 Tax=unclassified Paludibacterium TaxID=2618429 RepID=UPI00207B845C|nr:class I SAM-dependent methyltransferase [Paludibacterium sp. B53371]BEV71004.1 hypothetical protein THUN1379_04860 [Paludibacterium sp. THUN1379]
MRALAIQLLAALLAWYFVAPLAHVWRWALLASVFACLLARVCRSRGVAVLLQGLPLPLAVLVSQSGLPAWLFMLAFLLTLAFGRNAWLARVPLYRSSEEVAQQLAAVLPEQGVVLEAGAGDARLALRLASLRPDLQVHALENAWGSFCLARLRWLRAGRPANVRVALSDFWRVNWQDYDSVYVFLSPAPMKRVWDKFQMQARPGAMLISNTFAVPGVEPEQRLPLSGRLQQSLLLWRAAHGTE